MELGTGARENGWQLPTARENTDESGSAASDQTAAPEDELNENVTYHYRYTSSRNSDGAGSRQWKLLRFQQQFRYFRKFIQRQRF